MKPIKTWILIADGAQARIVLNDGPGKGIKALDGLEFSADHRATRDIMADRPGRTFDKFGPGRHAKEYSSDPHRQLKKRFAAELAGMLDEKLRAGAYDRLVLLAPPAMLGDLRAELSEQVRAKLVGEVAKDLTKVPLNALPNHLEDIIAV